MAYKHTEKIDVRKLIEQSEKARETITEARVELKNKFDVAGRVREMVTSDPAKLVGGSLIGGFVIKKLFSRKKRYPEPKGASREKISHLKTERGILLGLLGLLLAVAKPAAKMYATKLLKDYLKRRLQTGSVSRRDTRKLSPY